jgi:hypothetical protein
MTAEAFYLSERQVINMSIFSGLFRSRDKPKDATTGSSYRFFFGGTTSGKAVTERSAMQMTAGLLLRPNSLRGDCRPANSPVSL